jgi:thiol:disulfide interchange protein DsbD
MNKIKSFWILLLTIISCTSQKENVLHAQPGGSWQDHLKLEASVKMEENCEATLQITATLQPDWHIFSIKHDPDKADGIGSPSVLSLGKNKFFSLLGKNTESKAPKKLTDDLGTQLYHEKSVVFSQKIKILSQEPFDITGDFEFQICNEEGCIFPPAQEFVFKIKPTGDCSASNVPVESVDTNQSVLAQSNEEPKVDDLKDVTFDANEKDDNKKNLLMLFVFGFISGLAALLTPCVFPLIPMTVSFFTKQSKSRMAGVFKALMYGFAIVFIYVLLGGILSQFMSAFGLNELSSNIWMNLIFFAIFILFAFSFLGAFEIRMPSKLVNSADRQADKGGLIGVFFMAFTLVLVSFSCTGPIVGSLLVESVSTGNMASPIMGMFGFGLALALPFTLFAIFPSWLSSLPQSGGWLNSVKVVLGLLELAIAMKFLSRVDMAYEWNILTREIFIAVWVVVFAIIGFYLLGKIRFAHDDKIEKLSVTRFMFALTSLVFTVYLIPGMWGAPVFMVEGIAPPRHHSEDGFEFVRGSSESNHDGPDAEILKDYTSYIHHIQDGSIYVFMDREKGYEFANKVNKPVLLDFTGYTCENCRKTEARIWLNKTIKPILKDQFVIVSMYVDDKTPLPESEHYYSEESQGKIKTVGNRWADYQIKKYKQISQPLYIVVDPKDDTDLTAPRGYDPSVEGYEAFLMKGLNRYHERRK